MPARSSSHMIRLRSAHLKHACHHLFRCRKSAPTWAILAVWRRTTRLILALAHLRKLSPKEPALMLCPALIGAQSSCAIRRRGRQEGDMDMSWHDDCFSWRFLSEDHFVVVCLMYIHNSVAMELLQIRQAGSVWITQSSCWWQAQDQGAFCEGKPDIKLKEKTD